MDGGAPPTSALLDSRVLTYALKRPEIVGKMVALALSAVTASMMWSVKIAASPG